MKKQFYSLALGAVMLFAFTATSFAQKDAFTLKKPINLTSEENVKVQKSVFIVGGGFYYYYTGYQGEHFFINGSEFSEIEEGNQITHVAFYHHLGTVEFDGGSSETYTNTEYTIKIYENPVLGGDSASVGLFDTNIGTPVYQQSVTVNWGIDSGGLNIAALATPYTVNSNDFWVAISFDNGTGVMRLGQYQSSADQYYMYYVDETANKTYIKNRLYTLGIALVVDDGVVKEVDLEADFVDNNADENPITQLTISETENLTIYPRVTNNGPDATDNVIAVSISSGSVGFISGNIDLASNPLSADASFIITGQGGYLTYTPSVLDNAGLTGTFTITYTITYGGTDTDPSNNTATLTVTRTTVDITEQDQMNAVTLYPNPVVSDQLKINNLTEATDINIYNITGQLVKTVSAATGSSVDINVANLSSGIYIVKMQSGKNIRTEKIQVVR